MMWMSPQLRSPAQPLNSSWNMTDLWSRTPTLPDVSQPESTSSEGFATSQISRLYFKHMLTVVHYLSLSSVYFSHSFSCISIIQKCHFVWCCTPPPSLKENNEDLLNAKTHMGVPLIAAVSYQSLKQMAYQLDGFVLDMSTTLHRGDLSEIMCTKDEGIFILK